MKVYTLKISTKLANWGAVAVTVGLKFKSEIDTNPRTNNVNVDKRSKQALQVCGRPITSSWFRPNSNSDDKVYMIIFLA